MKFAGPPSPLQRKTVAAGWRSASSTFDKAQLGAGPEGTIGSQGSLSVVRAQALPNCFLDCIEDC